jgi:MoaA/NifB/PqqE/SkfB family radical SAM enzyme
MHAAAVTAWTDRARLAHFFTKLAIKEHVAPRLRVRPLVAELFLTDNCNLKCVSCACWRTVTRDELTTDEWTEVIDQLAAAGIVKANFTGGEPLLRRDAPALMLHAREAGIRSLHLNTNAMLLDDKRRAAVLEAGVRSVNISVDGPNAEVHERVRGVKGSFERTVRNLEALLAEGRRHRLRVRMNFTVMRSNVESLPEMMRLAQRLGVRLYLNLASDSTFLFRDQQVTLETRVGDDRVNAALAEIEQLLRADGRFLPSFSELRYMRGHFSDILQRDLPCAESQLKLMIHSRGEIGGCWGHDAHDNVRDTSVAEVLASDRYRDEHARYYKKECVGCGSNYALNLSWRPRTHLENLRWRLGRRSLASEPA